MTYLYVSYDLTCQEREIHVILYAAPSTPSLSDSYLHYCAERERNGARRNSSASPTFARKNSSRLVPSSDTLPSATTGASHHREEPPQSHFFAASISPTVADRPILRTSRAIRRLMRES